MSSMSYTYVDVGELFERGPSPQGVEAFIKLGDTTSNRELPREKAYHAGVKAFKRKNLGFCGLKKRVTEDEMLEALVENNLANSRDQARELIPYLENTAFRYMGTLRVPDHILVIRGGMDRSGNKGYSIEVHMVGPPSP